LGRIFVLALFAALESRFLFFTLANDLLSGWAGLLEYLDALSKPRWCANCANITRGNPIGWESYRSPAVWR